MQTSTISPPRSNPLKRARIESRCCCFWPTKILLLALAGVQSADCVRAEPVIYKTLEKSEKDVILLRAFAGNRPTWRNPSHPWRADERFKLKGLPTLARWKDGAIAGRLEDHEAHIDSRIEKLLD
ncbi:thioredoxin-like protein Clot isoform X2 [Cryptomeria japonica]|uniref:thioredoxin-like protein Clot isoform X2 n=1 Tax=Cryptomeria japonica TaxID=3369 RepID=UPI0025ABDF7A|nr:thioredoxin-like protein Clot isoform X2 [Cryptomeria japonica]